VEMSEVQSWIDRYVEAWRTTDDGDIRALFTEDADYFTAPSRPPYHGHDAIVALWKERADPPDSYRYGYDAVAVDGDLGVVRGWTEYLSDDRASVIEAFDNVYLIKFSNDGRAAEFTEFFMERPKPSEKP
jgi:uncharacterized protein (TIGR02246 family)